jgi:hypothetical protein
MLVLPTTAAQLQPGSRVAVFPRNDASGETLGFFGTIVSARRIFDSLPQASPAAWIYLVSGPDVGEWQIARASQILLDVPDDEHVADGPTDVDWQVRFDDELGQEGGRISGKYRLARRCWARFEFVTCDDDVPRYELRLPANALACETPTLRWFAPANATLDREYVRRALAEVFGSSGEHCPD